MLGSLRKISEEYLNSIAKALARYNIDPNFVTSLALLSSTISAIFFFFKIVFLAAIFLALSGFLDLLDGMIARISKRETRLGNVMDSVMDRYSDFLPILSIGFAGLAGWPYVALAIFGSMIPSYVRAKIEMNLTNSMKGKVILGERADRLIILIFFSLIYYLYENSFNLAFILIFIIGNFAAMLRLYYNYNELKKFQ